MDLEYINKEETREAEETREKLVFVSVVEQ